MLARVVSRRVRLLFLKGMVICSQFTVGLVLFD